jgi:glycosyltransferase involved in cell wall biosynthesis
VDGQLLRDQDLKVSGMKILIIQESDWIQRGPHQQHQLADRLSLRGHQVRVIDYEILWQEEKKHGLYAHRQVFHDVWKIDPDAKVTVIRPGILKIPALSYVSLIVTHYAEIQRQLKEFKPDIMIGFGILNNYLALKLGQRNHVPFVYYWIDVLHRLIPLRVARWPGKLIERSVLRGADRVLTINDKLKEYVLAEGAAPDTEVICAGIDVDKFKPLKADQVTAIRREYGIKDTDRVLFFMGWLYHFSGVKEIAIELAKLGASGLKLVVVGEGDALEDLKAIRGKYRMQESLILTGQKPYSEIPGLIAASDICVLPAYPWEKIMQDIVPIKLYEYMAMRKPVICTRLPGVVREFGEDNGIVYVDRPEDTIAKANQLIKDGIITQLGERSRQFVQQYDWEPLTDRFVSILEEEIQKKKNGHPS